MHRTRSALLALTLWLLAAAAGTAAATPPDPARFGKAPRRPPVSSESLAKASGLHQRAENLRQLRIPLLERRARRNISRVSNELKRLGVEVHRDVPVVFDSTREYSLLRQAGALLRGARPGSEAYALRKKVVTRAFRLHRTMMKLPQNMRAFTSIDDDQHKLVINLDNPFYGKHDQLLTIMAHEYRHLGDVAKTDALKRRLQQPELRQAKPGTSQSRLRQRLQRTVDTLSSSPHAEARAFEAQALVRGLAGMPLGNWWRAPQGNELDKIYPPARLNQALIEGYFKGVSRGLGEGLPGQRDLARRYLAGYRSVLRAQADAYFTAFRADVPADRSAIERYHAKKNRVLDRAHRQRNKGGPLTTRRAFLAGQVDAYLQVAPGNSLRNIIGSASGEARAAGGPPTR